jgi:sugar phosphate isomerase/epimerase
MSPLIKEIQVNIPFVMLYESYLERFVKLRLNPEIGFDAIALDRYSLSDFSGTAARLHESCLTITLHAPFVDLSPGSPDPKIGEITRSRFEQVVRLISVFRPQTLVCHAGYDGRRYGYIRDLWVEKSLEMWTWLAKRVTDEGSSLVLENVYEEGPDDMRSVFEHLQKQKVGFCLDTGHQAAFGGAPLETWIESLGPYIAQVHLHDNSGKQDEHQALGQGTIDFEMLFKKLRTIRKKPPIITLEPHREEHLWPSFEYLENIWPW